MGQFEGVAPSFKFDALAVVAIVAFGGGGASAAILRSTRAISIFGPRKQGLARGRQQVNMDAPVQKHARDNVTHEPFVSVQDLVTPTNIESTYKLKPVIAC